jgi:hypothetical protein
MRVAEKLDWKGLNIDCLTLVTAGFSIIVVSQNHPEDEGKLCRRQPSGLGIGRGANILTS